MKTFLLSLALLTLASLGHAQEIVPSAEAFKAAAVTWLASADITDAPFAVDPDIKQPFAIKHGDIGAMLIPETKLARELDHPREGITPIGQLWMKGVLPAASGSAITTDKLRMVQVSEGGTTMLLPVLYLGMQNAGSGKELVVCSQDKTPLFTVPLTPIETSQKLPLEMSAVGDDSKRTAEVTLNIAGKLQGKFSIAAAQ